MIQLEGATVSVPSPPHSRRTILHDINLSIDRGEWVALLGGNGAGKSTLLAVLASLLPLSEGVLTVAGEGSKPPRVGLLLQEPDNQLVTSSVARELQLSLPTGTADASRVAEASRRFDLDALWSRNPHELSGGEKQRLALATVWLQNPDIVLLDEPTAFLDGPSTERCLEFVREMHRGGSSVVWVSPGEGNVELADTVVCLDGGESVFYGPASEYAQWPGRSAFAFPPAPVRRARELPGDTALVFDGVTFGYDDQDVLSQFDLRVGCGECLGVAGNNGAGKTTLLLLAGGVLEPRDGRLERPGPPGRANGSQHVFYMPQSPERMFFAESVLEELMFGLRRMGVSKVEAQRRAMDSLAGVGLDPNAFDPQREPFQLSHGEMRRVAFAVGNVLDPSLLLLDEPSAGLDPDGVALLYRLLDGHRSSGTTVVIASHDHRVLDACDRIVTLGV